VPLVVVNNEEQDKQERIHQQEQLLQDFCTWYGIQYSQVGVHLLVLIF
jgi:hypothetical protein